MTSTLAWSADDQSRARTMQALEQQGFVLLKPNPEELKAELANREPWETATCLFGQPPELVERQPIAPVPWGQSFASTSGDTPLHTDSQLYAGGPPDLQLMFCEREAREGGETTLLDAWALLERLERDDAELHRLLFHQVRRIPFVFGAVVGPTVSLRRGGLVFTHTPIPLADEPIARRLQPHLEKAPLLRVRPVSGELLVVDNHRMLHGRTAFEDDTRKFTRLLVWLDTPLESPERLRTFASHALTLHAQQLAELPLRVRRQLGLEACDRVAAIRRRIVLEMLRGVPPGVLSRRHGVDEAELYAWRDRALASIDAELAADHDDSALFALARRR